MEADQQSPQPGSSVSAEVPSRQRSPQPGPSTAGEVSSSRRSSPQPGPSAEVPFYRPRQWSPQPGPSTAGEVSSSRRRSPQPGPSTAPEVPYREWSPQPGPSTSAEAREGYQLRRRPAPAPEVPKVSRKRKRPTPEKPKIPRKKKCVAPKPGPSTYYHSRTLQPIDPSHEYVDSDDDNEWLKEHSVRMLEEFTDVNEGEKEIMKMWNVFVLENGCSADKYMFSVCKKFVEQQGKILLRKNLLGNFILHLSNLYDYEKLCPEEVYNIILMVQKLLREDDYLQIVFLDGRWRASYSYMKSGGHGGPRDKTAADFIRKPKPKEEEEEELDEEASEEEDQPVEDKPAYLDNRRAVRKFPAKDPHNTGKGAKKGKRGGKTNPIRGKKNSPKKGKKKSPNKLKKNSPKKGKKKSPNKGK